MDLRMYGNERDASQQMSDSQRQHYSEMVLLLLICVCEFQETTEMLLGGLVILGDLCSTLFHQNR